MDAKTRRSLNKRLRQERADIASASKKRGLWANIGSSLGSLLAMAVTGGAAAPIVAGMVASGLSYVGGSLGNILAKSTRGGKIKGGRFYQGERESLASDVQEGVEAGAVKTGFKTALGKLGGKISIGKGGIEVSSGGKATVDAGSGGGFNFKDMFKGGDEYGAYGKGLIGKLGRSLDFKGSALSGAIDKYKAASILKGQRSRIPTDIAEFTQQMPISDVDEFGAAGGAILDPFDPAGFDTQIYDTSGKLTDTIAADVGTFADTPIYPQQTEGPGSFLPRGKGAHIKALEDKMFEGSYSADVPFDAGVTGDVAGMPYERGDFIDATSPHRVGATAQGSSLDWRDAGIKETGKSGSWGAHVGTSPVDVAREKGEEFYKQFHFEEGYEGPVPNRPNVPVYQGLDEGFELGPEADIKRPEWSGFDEASWKEGERKLREIDLQRDLGLQERLGLPGEPNLMDNLGKPSLDIPFEAPSRVGMDHPRLPYTPQAELGRVRSMSETAQREAALNLRDTDFVQTPYQTEFEALDQNISWQNRFFPSEPYNNLRRSKAGTGFDPRY